jgi:hypothetical protein
MAIEMAAATQYDVRVEKTHGVTRMFTVLTVQEDADSFSALNRELGISSDGTSAADAASNVKRAVQEALTVAEEQGVSAGEPVDDEAVLEFLLNHRGPEPVTGFVFTL